MDIIKIMIVDDIKEIRNYFNSTIEKEDDMQVIASAGSGVEAVAVLKEKQPDVILLDIQMETKTAGIDFARFVNKKYPEIKIIILTIHDEDELLFQAYNAGVMDYIVKSSSVDQIVSSVRNVHENKLLLRPDVAEKIIGEFSKLRNQQKSMLFTLSILSKLTNSEFEVLCCIYEGNSYRDVAASRFVSQATIKSQVNSILKKFEMTRMKDIITLLKELDFYEILKSFKREGGDYTSDDYQRRRARFR